MSDSLTTFGKKLDTLVRDYERMPNQMVRAAAETYVQSIRGSIGSMTRGGVLRGVGKYNQGRRKGAKVGVKPDIRGTRAFVQATGPLHLLERNNKPHVIPRATRARRARTKSGRLSHKRIDTGRPLNQRIPLFYNNRWHLGPVQHPGTTGKHPFEKGVDAADVPARLAAETIHRTALARLFR